MMKDKKLNKRMIMAALCSLVLCVLLCGCSNGRGQVIPIGDSGTESAFGAETASDTGTAAGGTMAAGDEGKDTGTADTEPVWIKVYVCGAVASPGVVTLSEGSRGEDALEAAGGFAENAWREYVNLAERVEDGQKLYFPTLDEAEGDLLVLQETDDGLVNINTADVETLCTLPGIGESRARDIIAYREKNGAFESCEDIMKVSGIKDSVYSRISDRIKVR